MAMEAVAEDVETGEKITVKISDDDYQELKSLAQDKVSDSKLQFYIDNLEMSADAKALIASILKTAIKVGDLVVRVGKRIVELAVMMTAKFPHATFGLILGLLIGVLITAIPIFGPILGSLVVPLAAAFGLARGYSEDLQDLSLKRKIAEASAMFNPLNGEVHVTS